MSESPYRGIDCPNCGRSRVLQAGVCDKCEWDVDGGDFANVTRPEECVDNHWVGEKPPESHILSNPDETQG